MDTEKTLTVFRKWNNGSIIALFPRLEHDRHHCMSYEHVGQHGGADYTGVVMMTRPAKPEEYADLRAELESIGYNLDIKTRAKFMPFPS